MMNPEPVPAEGVSQDGPKKTWSIAMVLRYAVAFSMFVGLIVMMFITAAVQMYPQTSAERLHTVLRLKPIENWYLSLAHEVLKMEDDVLSDGSFLSIPRIYLGRTLLVAPERMGVSGAWLESVARNDNVTRDQLIKLKGYYESDGLITTYEATDWLLEIAKEMIFDRKVKVLDQQNGLQAIDQRLNGR